MRTSICKNDKCKITFIIKSGCKGLFCSISCAEVGKKLRAKSQGLKIKERFMYQYNLKSKACLYCKTVIPYEKRSNNFCDKTCSTIFNNSKRDPECYKRGIKKLKETILKKKVYKTKIKWCKITGKPISKYRPYDSDPWYRSPKIKTIKRLCNAFNIHLGNTNTSEKLTEAANTIKQMYEIELKTPFDISQFMNIDESLIYWILIICNVTLRDSKSANELYLLTNGPSKVRNQYKCGDHIDWEGNSHWFRSSYELRFYKQLDNQLIHYETETLRIKYFDNVKQKYRIAIPDVIVDNYIFEIKSNYTYDKENMSDKFNQYKILGYHPILVLENKCYHELP